jgi:hypothetical protein
MKTYQFRRLSCFLALFAIWASALSAAESRFATYTARAAVGSDAIIGGFVIDGTTSKAVLIRAAGPALAKAGLTGTLTRPLLQVYDSTGKLLDTNNAWSTTLKTTFTAVGASSFTDGSADAALLLTLAPGSYTAQITGISSTQGLAQLEVYEADTVPRLLSFSTRAQVGTGDAILQSKLVVSAGDTRTVLIRAAGPALSALGIKGYLADPSLTLLDSTGKTIASNNNWGSDVNATTIASKSIDVGAIPFASGSKDAAFIATLSAGTYSIQVTGQARKTGLALLEVFDLTPPSTTSGSGTDTSGGSTGGTTTPPPPPPPTATTFTINGPFTYDGTAKTATITPNPVGATFTSGGTLTATNAGSYVATATASGSYSGSNTNLSWTINKANQGTVVISPATQTITAGSSLTFTASGGSGTGTFVWGGAATGSTVTFATAGTFTVTVYRAGDSNYFQSSTATATITVNAPTSTTYSSTALSWTRSAIDSRLGPSFELLNPGATDTRPTIFATSATVATGYFVRINPYDVGAVPGYDNDYWSDSGQVGYSPDDTTNDAGLDRIQTFAYYNQVWATAPRLDYASGTPHSDPQTRDTNYVTLNGGVGPKQPVAMHRGYGMAQSEALVIYRDGLFAVAGTQTSRTSTERPYPGFKFPANKVPRAITATTNNEFALVVVWDTDLHKSQLAVVACEGKYLAYHTWPYMGLPNQGSWSDFKLLGYVDLPMASANSIASACNGWWNGPSSTGGYVLSQIDLSNDTDRLLCYSGSWQGVVAKGGYAIVSSTDENKAVIVDLTPLFAYMRDSYLASATNYANTIATRGSAPDQFPQAFSVKPSIAPQVILETTVTKPTAVLAGHLVGRWSLDPYKAYIACQDGTVHIWDVSSIMKRYSWEILGTLREMGTTTVGRNPVSMAFVRHGEAFKLPLLPIDSTGAQPSFDRLNNVFYVACRGDREVDAVVTYKGVGQTYRKIRDTRMGDPVAVSVAYRGNIVTVADFHGKKLLSFRVGTLSRTLSTGTVLKYPVGGDGTYDFELSGQLSLPGAPFMVGSANVN